MVYWRSIVVSDLIIPEPGLHTGCQESYFAWDAISSTDLKHLCKSPAHFKANRAKPHRDTKALRVGRMFHELTLGTSSLGMDGGKLTKTQLEERQLAIDMAISASANPLIKRCLELTKQEHREIALVWHDEQTGVLCKALLDAVFMMPILGQVTSQSVIWDLKSTEDASDYGCQKAFNDYDYFLQSAHYFTGAKALGLDPKEFWYFFVEKADPYCVNHMVVSEDAICDGQVARYKLLRRYQECLATNEWPGYYSSVVEPKQLAVPIWKKRQIGEM
jgi:hypothetical protein